MKLPRTAAAALAGWTLILPPTSNTLRLNMTKDLSQWKVHSTHATSAECEQEKQRLIGSMTDQAGGAPKSSLRRPGRDLLAARYRSARCVSASDPALRSKDEPASKSN